MRKLYEKIDAILSKLDFNAIWPGFTGFGFALYNDESVYFKDSEIPYDRRFLGNTAIEYDGAFIAIWNVANPLEEDAEILASNMVHEMFHAYQRNMGEGRYAHDLVMLDYPDDFENYQVKQQENLILAEACEANGFTEKAELFGKFLSARKYREGIIGGIIRQEYLAETIEGMAEYAGCMALRQISAGKYAARIEKHLAVLRDGGDKFFDIRRGLYSSGAIACLVMNGLGIDFYHEIGKENETLFELVSRSVMPEKPVITEGITKENINSRVGAVKARFEDFLLKHHNVAEGDFVICGYDPMNMLKMNDMILCSHFIMLANGNGAEPIFIPGPVLAKLKKGTVNEVYSYIK